VLNRFNRLRQQFPWLQTLQPLSPAIIPLSLEVILPELTADDRSHLLQAVKEASSFGVRSMIDGILQGAGARSQNWSNDADESGILKEWFADYENNEHVWGKSERSVWIKRVIERMRRYFATRQLKGLADRTTFFNIDSLDENYQAVSRLVSNGAGLVIHGHTHAAKAYPVSNGLYVNSGTWGQLTRLPDHEMTDQQWVEFLDQLREGKADSFSRLTFAHIKKEVSSTTAKLCQWVDQGVQVLSDWHFSGGAWERRN
jgi:hypothetical protein